MLLTEYEYKDKMQEGLVSSSSELTVTVLKNNPLYIMDRSKQIQQLW